MRALRALPLIGDRPAPLRDILFLDHGRDPLTQRIRCAQVDGLVGLLPLTNLINLFSACLLVTTLAGKVPAMDLALWVGSIAILAAPRPLLAHIRNAVPSPYRYAECWPN
jgi:hypothetical protein